MIIMYSERQRCFIRQKKNHIAQTKFSETNGCLDRLVFDSRKFEEVNISIYILNFYNWYLTNCFNQY
jgi:hypothetical protein